MERGLAIGSLFGAAVVLAVLGFVFWHAAEASQEDASLEAFTPQLIGVFSTDPDATVHLTTQVFWHDVSGFGFAKLPFELVYVSATVPHPTGSSAILITSTIQPSIIMGKSAIVQPDMSYKSAVFYGGFKPFSVLDSHEYVTQLPIQSIEHSPGATQYGIQVGFVELPQVTQESRGSFFAHLPAIGFGAIQSDPYPYLISERGSPSQPEHLIEAPEPKDLGNLPTSGRASTVPSEYQAPPGQQLQTAYWEPASLTTTEILEDVNSEVDNAAASSIVPDGSLQGYNYVWQGDGPLEPTMSVTNQDAAASHNTWTFFSGIFFGVAAGAFVSFVQEKDNPLLSWLGRSFSRYWRGVRAHLPS